MTNSDQAPSHPVFAALYDAIDGRVEDELFREHRESLASDLRGSVLDLGAGTGAMFPYFASAVERDPSLTFRAIEPDSHMRRRAVRRANDLDLDIEIRAAGAQSLPYADDSFEVVVASLVFCTIPDVEAALDEVARVLASGGEFRFLEHVHADGWLARVQDVLNPVWRRGVAGCNLNRDTVATFEADDRFVVTEVEELESGIPPAKPFVRGTLVRSDGHGAPDGAASTSDRPTRES